MYDKKKILYTIIVTLMVFASGFFSGIYFITRTKTNDLDAVSSARRRIKELAYNQYGFEQVNRRFETTIDELSRERNEYISINNQLEKRINELQNLYSRTGTSIDRAIEYNRGIREIIESLPEIKQD